MLEPCKLWIIERQEGIGGQYAYPQILQYSKAIKYDASERVLHAI